MELHNHKKLFVVLGMHRSGTSAIARALKVFDIPLGDNFIPPVENVNPQGFWEDKDINALNIEMMNAINIDWHSLTPIQSSDMDALRKKGYFARAEALINAKLEDLTSFGIKDPRIAKLMPFWKEVFDHCQYDQYYILVLRNPLSVAKSLAKRDGFPHRKSYYLWLDHVITSLHYTQREKRIVLDYDRLLQHPKKELGRVSKSFGLRINAVELKEYVTNFLDSELCHAKYNKKEVLSDDKIPPLAGEIYSLMSDGASDKFDICSTGFESKLKSWIDELERIKPALMLADELDRDQAEHDAHVARNQFAKIGELLQVVAEPDSILLKAQLSDSWYIQQNPDIAKVGVDPYEHWLNNGMTEGRLPTSDPVLLARGLVSEREQSLRRVAIEEKERELRQAQHESFEWQKDFTERLIQLQQAASQERAAQMEAAQREQSLRFAIEEKERAAQMEAAQREQSLRFAIEEKERELRQVLHESLERQNDFTERLIQLQQAANQERASLKDQYSRHLYDLNYKLGAIQATWTWRLTSPLRILSELIGIKPDYSLIDPHQIASAFASEDQKSVVFNPATNTFNYHASTSVDKDKQESSTTNSSWETISSARTLDELLAYDDGAFVTCAYLTLLGRAPDPQGFTYYMGRLKKYGNKLAIIYQIYLGQEAKPFINNIAGLTAAMKRQKWKQAPILGAVLGVFDRNSKKVNQEQPNEAMLPAHQASIQSTSVEAATGTSKDMASYFMQPADEVLQDDGYTFTRLMHYIWILRLDLQKVFDIYKHDGRFEFCKWFLCNASNEYGLTPNVYPKDLLKKLALLDGTVRERAESMLDAQANVSNHESANLAVQHAHSYSAGANLIGYAFGEFGMGEHVRMTARSLNTLGIPFCIIDQDVGLHGAGDASVGHWVIDTPQYNINIFHINADVFPPLYFKFGESFFSGRYNVGYWAWELSKCPSEFDLALSMVDEVWAISEFVAQSFKTRSPVPVIAMPLAVTVPELGSSYTKSYYGLPEDAFVFFFTFDAASYLDRKNPTAVVRAFKLAFPHGNEKVHLLLKTMNTDVAGPLWGALLEEINSNPRITIMSKRLTREEVLGLNLACDAFVSLHRSEGFGFCVAEAMAYGKPVIVTNYSGTRDFAMEGTACVVDYRLIPVPEGAYPFWKDQAWAEPDIEHAAVLMKKITHDEIYRTQIALAGQKYVLDNFNESIIGERYAKRLDEIQAMRSPHSSTSSLEVSLQQTPIVSNDELAGSIDAPTLKQCNEISDVLLVEGWVASIHGIECVEIYINSAFVGKAHYGILRQDIYNAFPHMTNAARSGFCYQVATTGLPKGNHTLGVVAKSRSGETKQWVIDFTLVDSTRYQKWLEKSGQVYGNKKFHLRPKAKNLFSLLLRVESNPDHALLMQTLKSLAAQDHAKFEIIVIADSSQHQAIMGLVEKVGLSGKFRFATSASNDWMSKVADCHGHLVGLMDAGDIFRPWTLSDVDDVIRTNKHAGLVYADEDALYEGVRCKPIFKPGWSPIFLDNYNYIGRPWFALKSVIASALSSLDFGGGDMNEHLLLKEMGRISSSVCHIPSVLVSRNNYSKDKLEQIDANKKPIDNRDGIIYPKVSIIIPTRLSDIDLVERCFAGLSNLTDYPDMEVIIAVNNVADSTLIESFISKWPFKVITWNDPFSWSGINNFGAAHATGDYLLFLNDDIEPLNKDWLKIMVQTLVVTGAGVVGSLLKYPDGTIQHLGINFVDYGSGVRHLFRFCTGNEQHLKWLMNYPREVSAVTGACLLTTRECFNTMGGFDEELPLVCNDTDFCLRVLEKGYSIIIQPEAKLIHHEGISRAGMPEVEDVSRFWGKWEKLLKRGDQFTNPNLDATRDDWTVNSDIKAGYVYRISSGR